MGNNDILKNKIELCSNFLKVHLTSAVLKCTMFVNIGNAKTGTSTRRRSDREQESRLRVPAEAKCAGMPPRADVPNRVGSYGFPTLRGPRYSICCKQSGTTDHRLCHGDGVFFVSKWEKRGYFANVSKHILKIHEM